MALAAALVGIVAAAAAAAQPPSAQRPRGPAAVPRRLAEPLYDGSWETVAEQRTIPDPYAEGIPQPSVRYSSTTVPWRDLFVATHGYFYNRNVKPASPAWLRDTWAFSYVTHRWNLLNDGKGVAPSPRYGHTAFVHDDAMYFFGGDDGDHVASPTNYRSHHFNDLWRFDLLTKVWAEVPRPEGAPWPAPRSLHAGGLVGDEYLVFGGLGRNDTWGFNLRTRAWREFRPPTGPGIRYASSYAAAAGRLFVFGGARRGGHPYDDLWSFDPAKGAWSPLAPPKAERAKQVAAHSWPAGRSYGSLNTYLNPVSSAPSLALFGGANCSRGCKCKGDTWLWDLAAQQFTLVQVEKGTEPVPRYRQSLSEYKGSIYVFGGESYKPYMYHNSVSKLTLSAHGGGRRAAIAAAPAGAEGRPESVLGGSGAAALLLSVGVLAVMLAAGRQAWR